MILLFRSSFFTALPFVQLPLAEHNRALALSLAFGSGGEWTAAVQQAAADVFGLE